MHALWGRDTLFSRSEFLIHAKLTLHLWYAFALCAVSYRGKTSKSPPCAGWPVKKKIIVTIQIKGVSSGN